MPLGPNSYGKSGIRLLKVHRDPSGRHDITELTIDIALEGNFESAHTDGDNSCILPTDTMKNTVYALSKDHPIRTIESFALSLAHHFLSPKNPSSKHATRATVTISDSLWDRATVEGSDHPHTFTKTQGERAM